MNRPDENRSRSRTITRYFLMAFLPAAALIVAIAYSIYAVESNNAVRILIEKNRSMIELQREAITQDFALIISDVRFLVEETELKEAFSENDPIALAEAAKELRSFTEAKQIYDQVRFIDMQGMERIRINYSDAKATIVAKNKLQYKGDRYYVIESLKKNRGELYISPMDLNVEHGEIQLPYKPMIRFGSPVIDQQGNRLGILIVNYHGQYLLDHFIRIHAKQPELSHLVNRDGYWLHSYPHGLEWGFMFADKQDLRFQTDHALAWEKIRSQERGHLENEQGIYCFSTVNPFENSVLRQSDSSAVEHWKIIAFNSHAELRAMHAPIASRITLWTVIAALILALICWILSRAIVFRNLAADAVRLAEKRMNAAVEMALDCIITINAKGEVIGFNRAAEQTFGYTKQEILGKRVDDTIIPQSMRKLRRKAIVEYSSGEKQQFIGRRIELSALHRDGHEFPIELSVTEITTESSPIFTAFVRDLTEQKKSYERIRKLSQAIEQAGESIIITDLEGTIEYVNPAFCNITGYEADEVIGSNPRVLNSGEQNKRFYREMWKTIKQGQTWQGRIVDRRKDGSLFPAILNISPIFNESGNITHFIGLQQNMQEYEELEEQLQQSQKMEAIGTLVGGIAHDFNNSLAGIIGNLYLIKKRVSDQPNVISKVESIETLATRASEMIQQLMAFSRRSVISMQQIYLPSFIKEAAKLHEVSIPENIKLHFNIQEEEMYIHADAGQLQQMLFNLVNNARDALEGVEKPIISITLKKYIADRSFFERHPDTEISEFAQISVADNGSGIEAENLDHVFEPFFTTKGVGQGTGLGLSMVYGAVQSHGGFIELNSRKGKGTCFDIFLPLVSNSSDEASTTTLYTAEILDGKGETILLVDDDEALLSTVRDILEDMKYNIITASNGREAITTYLSHRHEIKLLIFDVVMPELGGVEAFLEIRKLDPAIQCIFTTGYDKSKVLESHGLADSETVLTKPYEVFDLARVVAQKLN